MLRKLINNWQYKLISVVFALLIWLAVTNTVDPTITRVIYNVPITITGTEALTEQGKVYTVESSVYATVRVRGRRSVITTLGADDFTATAPIDEMSIVYAVPVYVSIRNLNLKDDVEIYDNTKSVEISVEDLTTEKYDVSITTTGNVASGYYHAATKLNHDTIEITAPKSIQDEIVSVAICVDLTEATATFRENYTPILYDASGKEITISTNDNVTMSLKKIRARATVYKLLEIPIELSTTGRPADGYSFLNVESDPETITIMGDEIAVNGVSKIEIPGEIMNLDGASGDVEKTIDITDYLPDNVQLGPNESPNVDLIANITADEVRSYTIRPDEIKLKNLNMEQFAASISDASDITFELTGQDTDLDAIDINTLDMYVDLSEAVEGDNTCIVSMNLPDGVELATQITVHVQVVSTNQEETNAKE